MLNPQLLLHIEQTCPETSESVGSPSPDGSCKKENALLRLSSCFEDEDSSRNAKTYFLMLLIPFAATTVKGIVDQQFSCCFLNPILFFVLGVLCSYAALVVLGPKPRNQICTNDCNSTIPSRVVLDVILEYRKVISGVLASMAVPPLQPVSYFEQNSHTTNDHLATAKQFLDLLLQFSKSQAEFLHAAERSIHFIVQATSMHFSKTAENFNADIPVDRIELSLLGRWQRNQRKRPFVSPALPKMRRRVYTILAQQRNVLQALLLDLLDEGNHDDVLLDHPASNYADGFVVTIACLRSLKAEIGELFSKIASTLLELPVQSYTVDDLCRFQNFLHTQLHNTCQSTAYLCALQEGARNTGHTEDLDTNDNVFVRACKVLTQQVLLLQASLLGLQEDGQQAYSDKNTQEWWEKIKGFVEALNGIVNDVDLCLNPPDEQNDNDSLRCQNNEEKAKEISDGENVEHFPRERSTGENSMENQQNEQRNPKTLVYSCIAPGAAKEKWSRRKKYCSSTEDTTESKVFRTSDDFLIELQSRLQSMPLNEEVDANLPLLEHDYQDGEQEKENSFGDSQRLEEPRRTEHRAFYDVTFLNQLQATLNDFQLHDFESSFVHGE
jgi:hypothetical protein